MTDPKSFKPYGAGPGEGATVNTADGYPIIDGMWVWDNNLYLGTVDLSDIMDGWFYVRYPSGGKASMNAERVCVRHPFTGRKAEAPRN